MILYGGREVKILEGSSDATLTDTYTSRTTANGLANLKDGRFTTVKKIQGASVTPENVCVPPYVSTHTELNGITFTTKRDGSIILNGTSTGEIYYKLKAFTKDVLVDTGYYAFSLGNDKVTTHTDQYLNGSYAGSQLVGYETGLYYIDFSKGKYDTVNIYMRIRTNTTFDNDTITPLCFRVTTEKLGDINVVSTTSAIVNNSDGTITVTGSSTHSCNKKLKDLAPELVVGKTYLLHIDYDVKPTTTGIYLLGIAVWVFGHFETITQEMLDATVYFYGGGAGVSTTYSNFYLQEITTKFQNAYFKGITSEGKNLFISPHLRTPKTYDPTNISENDIYYGLTYTGVQYNAITDVTTTEGGITFKQNMAQSIAIGFPVRVTGLSSVAVSMFVSFPNTTQTASFYNGYLFLDASGNKIDNNAGYSTPNAKTGAVKTVRKVPEGAEWLIFVWGERYNTLPNRLASFSKIMMVVGETATDYTPYVEPSSMFLPEAVELPAYDYIDVERQKIVRQTGKKVFTGDGSNDGTWYGGTVDTSNGWGGTNTCGFYVYINGTNGGKNLDRESGFLTTPIKPNEWSGHGTDNAGTTMGVGYFVCRVPRSILTAYGSDNSHYNVNVTAFKAYLADLYAKGNPLTFLYKTNAITEEDINIPIDKYKAWVGGTETVTQGDIDNSNIGAECTITQDYKVDGISYFEVKIPNGGIKNE